MKKLQIGSLFAGIGGFDLGLERTGGFETAWFCEQAEYPTKILNQWWPGVPVYPDVTKLKGDDVEPIDVLVGGFPCQDISAAGRGAGISGARSSLWFEFARLIGELRPRYVIAENSPLLKTRGLNAVLGSLAEIGYDAEWDCIPAKAVGAHHERDRIWVVAYPSSEPGRLAEPRNRGQGREPADSRESAVVRQEDRPGGPEGSLARLEPGPVGWTQPGTPFSPDVPNTDDEGVGRRLELEESGSEAGSVPGRPSRDSETWSPESDLGRMVDGFSAGMDSHPWDHEPVDVPRVAEGVPNRAGRLSALGNALVPQIPEWIGYRILEFEAARA